MRRKTGTKGLTIIEVMVALAILAIVSVAIVGSFFALRTLNQDSSTEVDYSRAVRSAMERIRLEWRDPDLFDRMVIATVDDLTVNEFVQSRLDENCSAEVFNDSVVPDDVRMVRITCATQGGVNEQVYEAEFGRP